ncbi:MAG: Mur ligase family protein [Acidimicrobiales bacterium]
MTAVLIIGAIAAWSLATLRWLRVAQREHYIPGSVTRFARRWWLTRPPNPALAGLAVVGLASGVVAPWLTAAPIMVLAAAPVGLGVRGRSSPLHWTSRLRNVAIAAGTLEVGLLAVAARTSIPATIATLSAALAPMLVDVALAMLRPIETRMSEHFVSQAQARLRSVQPVVVAVTGSYGKTSTKEHIHDLIMGAREVVASPASFNNRLGLAKTINDHVHPGTEVLVAEVGTYGLGEIAAIGSWLKPSVSVLTAVGPVHLERFGSLEAIAEAKAEIFEGADTLVVNADDPLVMLGAERATGRLVRCSSEDPAADVFVRSDGCGGLTVRVAGERLPPAPGHLFPMNVACAIGAATALGVPNERIARQLPALSSPAHRQAIIRVENGPVVIDDSYNANPAGAAAALERLTTLASQGGRRIVVTPGLIELGDRQATENYVFAQRAASVATEMIIVHTTNRKPLLEGAAHGGATLHWLPTRDQAASWVAAHASPGDVVLYENDLPDHYP